MNVECVVLIRAVLIVNYINAAVIEPRLAPSKAIGDIMYIHLHVHIYIYMYIYTAFIYLHVMLLSHMF